MTALFTRHHPSSSTRRAAVTALLLSLLTVSGCIHAGPTPGLDDAPPTPTAPADNDRPIVVALAWAPTSLDPTDHRERQSETVIRNMFDGLVTRDTLSGVHLELAEEVNWLDDRTLEIKLRRSVLFHDGADIDHTSVDIDHASVDIDRASADDDRASVEMTADDVAFTFNRIMRENGIEYPVPHTSLRRGLVGPLASVEIVDRYTVRMHLSSPWPPAMQMLVHQQIVPRHYLEAVGTEGFIEHPIGTGPFQFVSADPDLEEIVLERFEEYYGGAPDLPPTEAACVERVIFRVIPDALTRAAALRAGEVDLVQAVPLDLIEPLEGDPGVRVLTAPGTHPKWMELNVTRPPFDDVRVRQALNYAVDKERLIEEVYGGRAVALPGPLSPFNNFVNRELQPYPHDPDKALELLASAGWRDVDQDGVLDREGQRFELVIDTLEAWRPLGQAVADYLQGIGIDASVRTWEYRVIKPLLLDHERTAYLDGWGDSAFDPVGHFEAKWHAHVEGEAYGRGNFSGYDNPRVNERIRRGETVADATERRRIYGEAQRMIYEEAPAVFLVLPEEIWAASTRVENWQPAADGRINLHDVCVAP